VANGGDDGGTDAVLVGSGIMSATLAALLRGLDPGLSVRVIEAGPELSRESSDGWHNAGTGHAGICELSYTPGRSADGAVDVRKALVVGQRFSHSLQFWGHAIAARILPRATDFIHAVPHVTFVTGQRDADFLRDRHAALVGHPFFATMAFSADPRRIEALAPLVMEGRQAGAVAASWMEGGTEVDYGRLARGLLAWLARQPGCRVETGRRVLAVRRTAPGWEVTVQRADGSGTERVRARFVFLGAGGGTLPLVQSAGIAAARGFAGFPIGGQWLVCDRADLAARHPLKVYGGTPPSAPSLGGPHLDLRRLDGRPSLLFGPFASWTTRFLRDQGRLTDLPRSIRPANLATLAATGVRNLGLIRYLVGQGLQRMGDRLAALREFYPRARAEDWRLVEAGIRVQTLKPVDRGRVTYGTEVLTDPSGTLAALLGASPGASVSVDVALQVVQRCFADRLASADGRRRMDEMIPTHATDLTSPSAARAAAPILTRAAERLGLPAPW
jgi:malate dehydrogenase (quinone)